MKKFKFKLDKATITATVPESWDEVTVKQFKAMDYETWDGLDIVEIIEKLCGIKAGALYNTNAKPLKMVYKALAFLQQPAPEWDTLKKQDTVTIWNKKIRIPDDLNNEAFGFYLEFQQLAEKGDIEKLTALYLQPVLDGKIDSKRRAEVEQSILNLPVIQILPILNFFFMKFREYQIYGRPVLHLPSLWVARFALRKKRSAVASVGCVRARIR